MITGTTTFIRPVRLSGPRKPPQTAWEAFLVIEEMRRYTKSKAARIKMAEMALRIGNIGPGARVVWTTYLAEEKA
jgi:hypothetical protein